MNIVPKVYQPDHTESLVYTLALELNTPCPSIVTMWIPSNSYEKICNASLFTSFGFQEVKFLFSSMRK